MTTEYLSKSKRKWGYQPENLTRVRHVPLLVNVFELAGHDVPPPLELGGSTSLWEAALNDAAIKIECRDLCGGLRVAVDAMKARTFGT